MLLVLLSSRGGGALAFVPSSFAFAASVFAGLHSRGSGSRGLAARLVAGLAVVDGALETRRHGH
jgi:hypothetical protein